MPRKLSRTIRKFQQILATTPALLWFFLFLSPLQSQDRHNYGEVLQKSILFYEAQQAGELPDWNRVPWRGDAVTNDGADVGLDLNGGWFDAGDHVKFGFPMAASVTTLAWGGIEYYDAYKKSGQLVHLSQNLKWVTDYFLKAFVNDTPGEYVLYGQVGDGKTDHKWWGAAEVVHYQMERPSYKIDTDCPGTELAAETSAALSASSILFRKNGDRAYADLLVKKAERLYDFADRYRGVYSDCLKAADPFYKSFSGYQDELVWGAIWLHKAKKAQNWGYSDEYLVKAETEYQEMSKPYNYTFLTDDKSYGVYVLLAKETGNPEYQRRAEAWLDFWTIGYKGKRIKYTPGGLAFLVKWGSLNLSANTSLLAFIYSDWLKTQGEREKSQRYFDFAVSQINYILGDNPDDRSYVIGYGNKSPRNPHHRTSHGSWANDSKNPPQSRNLLIGALVGGPDENEQWSDDRNDWVTNEVAIGYNAGFTGAVAKMYSEFGGQPLAEISFPENNEREIYVQSKVTKQNQGLKIKAAIVNKSATPARGLENARLRIMYTIEPEKADLVSVSSPVNDCSNDPSEPVKVKDNLYYVEINCQGTVIYPGGQSEYQKQVELQLNFGTQQSSIFTSLSSIFSQPIQVNSISLYNEKELIWEKTMN
ncbi:MAG: hypothetical protein Tsb0014_05690 [Pleurocapsa sp.]